MPGFKWTQSSALAELSMLINQIEPLMAVRRRSADHVAWVIRTTGFLEEIFGRNSSLFQTFLGFRWAREGTVMVHLYNAEAEMEHQHQVAYTEQLDSAKGLLKAALVQLDRQGIDGVYQGKNTAPESSTIIKVLSLTEHKLRKTIRVEPTNERQVQDAMETLFIAADIDFAREVDRIEYSSKSYVPDFTLAKIDLAIEVKFCNHDKREKEMIAEINDDILAYKTKYGNVLFVVYDVGQIRDIDKFKDHFEQQDQVIVQVIKH